MKEERRIRVVRKSKRMGYKSVEDDVREGVGCEMRRGKREWLKKG